MDTKEFLQDIMKRYTVDNLVVTKDEFKAKIYSYLDLTGEAAYSNDEKNVQRSQSLKFVWGHNHDFGEFKLSGQMGDRHIEIISKFIDYYGMPRDLSMQSVLDIGIWCGGTSLLLAGMGAFVIGVEEVPMYAKCANFLSNSFGLSGMLCEAESLYDYYYPNDLFDIIVFPGVLYHLSDPLLALRMLFNMLKDGGEMYIETMTTSISPDWPAIEYHGSQKSGWNWFAPNPAALQLMLMDVGFVPEKPMIENNRLITKAVREEWKPMVKAGLSRKIR